MKEKKEKELTSQEAMDALEGKKKKKINTRKLKLNTTSTLVTLVFVAIIVVINLIVNTVMNRYPLKLDLTTDKKYEISEETQEYLKSVNADVDIVVMMAYDDYFNSNSYMKVLSETLEKFEQYSSGHINVSYMDLTSNPEEASKYSSMYNGELETGDIAIVRDDRIRVISFSDIFESQQNYNADYTGYETTYTFKGEQSLVSGLVAITDSNPKTVAMLSLYNGENIYHTYSTYSVQMAQELLEKNGYTVETVDLMTGELDPAVYDFAVLPAPLNDLTENDIQKLEDFLNNNGDLGRDLIYIADAYQYQTPKLNEFLEIWGIEIGESVVYEYDSSKAQYVTTALGKLTGAVAQMNSSEDAQSYMTGLSNTKLPIVFANARPIKLLWDSNTDRSTVALLTTSETAFEYPLNYSSEKKDNNDFDAESAEKGQYTLMSVSTKAFNEGDGTYTSRLMCISSSLMLDYYISQNSSYLNTEFFINSVNIMEGKANGFVVADKTMMNESLTITQSQVTLIKQITMLFIPLIVLICGLVVYLKRKNK